MFLGGQKSMELQRFGLKRQMLDFVMLVHDALRLHQEMVAIDGVIYDQMAGQGCQAGADLPDVQVVHFVYAGQARQRALNRGHVDVGRGGFHQNIDRIAH